MVTVTEGFAITVLAVFALPLVVASTLAQYWYDRCKRAQDALAYMVEEEVQGEE